ncbi:MAG: septum formation inhibitor Maf [Chloroflexi bacterium]|nr:septum formation inhibitor Maf [Chloroflexota bacterium]MBM3172779.1 septum formation inhibitor Maf [Chloroflexota bacterium]MBM3174924.1 septum formation inhibitor Maf [Chloroflexota bacterium]MBM4449703.1 septum formation inhibitor Maf [Chloroflexota bacterium]
MKQLILASESPRRMQLLEQIGLKFQVVPSNSVEDLESGLDPHELAKSLSLRKASSVAKKYRNAVVIAADTFGVLEGKILGKPKTEGEAREMLLAMSGKTHSVITGFTILDADEGRSVSRSEETSVQFRKLTAGEIDAYVQSGEPLGKAGAYAIQGLGALLIERIDGDYFNVVGLPLCALAESLKEFVICAL